MGINSFGPYICDEDIYETRYKVGDIVEHCTYPSVRTYMILETGFLGEEKGMLRYYAMDLESGKTRYFNYLFDTNSKQIG
jgi:hypothetical protein